MKHRHNQATHGTGSVSHSTRGTRVWNVIVAVVAIGSIAMCAWFYLDVKSSFLDDSFIYLHIAGNVVETGSAQFYPVVDNPGLLASSPLRLLALIPSTFLSQLFAGARTIEAARLAFVLSVVIECLVFLPFYRRRLRRWLVGCALASFFGLTTETGLQMEGVLLFWCVFTLITFPPRTPRSGGWFSAQGIVVALMTLTRPEYGLVALALLIAYLVWRRDGRSILCVLTPVAVVAVTWVLLSLWVFDVYPIPTTYISKVLQAENGLSAEGTFFHVFARRIGTYFGSSQPALFVGFGVLVIAALWWVGGIFRAAIPMLIIMLLVSRGAAGNFLWYHENFYVVSLTVFVTAILRARKHPRGWPARVAILVLVVPLLLFSRNTLRNRSMTWNFRAEQSRGLSYQAIAGYHTGSGVFELPDLEPVYLQIDEIGIVSYFAGSDVWLLDRSGLAQPGNYKGVLDHRLSRFFPRDIFRLARDEYLLMNTRAGANAPERVFLAFGNPSPEHRHVCHLYYPDTGICLLEVRLRTE